MIREHEMVLKGNKGFPIGAAIWKKGKFIKAFANKKAKNKFVTNHKNHAEFLLSLDKSLWHLKNLNLLVTIPPCKKCYLLITKVLDIKKIFYILDPWKKMNLRAYLRNSKIPIQKYANNKYAKELSIINRRTKSAIKKHKKQEARSAL